jgi:hypothetical protein
MTATSVPGRAAEYALGPADVQHRWSIAYERRAPSIGEIEAINGRTRCAAT